MCRRVIQSMELFIFGRFHARAGCETDLEDTRLRLELQALRKKSLAGRLVWAARVFLNEHPGGLLLLLALLALAVALWQQFI